MANETVLVVEDEVLVGEEIREQLERFGYRVPEIVTMGEEVAAAVARHLPSLILMDIRIAGEIDGIEAAAQVRAYRDIPVIYLTAYSDQKTLARAADTEPAGYLLKPFSERELMANVSMVLSRPHSTEGELRRAVPFLALLDLPGILVDLDNHIRYANALALDLAGYADMGALRGKDLSELLQESKRGGARRTLRTEEGKKREVLFWSEAIESSDGKVLGTFAILGDPKSKIRRIPELTAVAQNAALQSRLPSADAAGEGYMVSGFLLSCPTGSGDLYDVFPLDDQRFAFYALDVMGHGLLPSLLANSLRGMIRLLAADRLSGKLRSPAEFVAALNRRYTTDAGAAFFFTLVYGEADRETGAYTFVRAGHPPLIRVPKDGPAVADLAAGGSALGVFGDVVFAESSGVLQHGDRLLLCSDGLLEGMSKDVAEGTAAVMRAAELGRSLESRVFAASVKAAALGRTGPDVILDDASMLMIERLAEDAAE